MVELHRGGSGTNSPMLTICSPNVCFKCCKRAKLVSPNNPDYALPSFPLVPAIFATMVNEDPKKVDFDHLGRIYGSCGRGLGIKCAENGPKRSV